MPPVATKWKYGLNSWWVHLIMSVVGIHIIKFDFLAYLNISQWPKFAEVFVDFGNVVKLFWNFPDFQLCYSVIRFPITYRKNKHFQLHDNFYIKSKQQSWQFRDNKNHIITQHIIDHHNKSRVKFFKFSLNKKNFPSKKIWDGHNCCGNLGWSRCSPIPGLAQYYYLLHTSNPTEVKRSLCSRGAKLVVVVWVDVAPTGAGSVGPFWCDDRPLAADGAGLHLDLDVLLRQRCIRNHSGWLRAWWYNGHLLCQHNTPEWLLYTGWLGISMLFKSN